MNDAIIDLDKEAVDAAARVCTAIRESMTEEVALQIINPKDANGTNSLCEQFVERLINGEHLTVL